MSKNAKRFFLAGALSLFFQLNVDAQCSSTGYKKTSQGQSFTVALKTDGSLWLWGYNTSGISGNSTGQTTQISHPWQMAEVGGGWVDVQAGQAYILALKANGDLYGWGDNSYGQLGTGDYADVYSPKLIMQNVKSYSVAYLHTAVIKIDGTMWGTGYNDWGNLGTGTSEGKINTWTQESSKATNWKSVGTGYYNTYGIKNDGTLWASGTNLYGQDAQPDSVGDELDVFTKVGTDTNWSSVSGGEYHALGLKTNGQLFAWGGNPYGQVGVGAAVGTTYYAPQQIAGTTWSSISVGKLSSFATKTDGSLWGWGDNNKGKIGTESIAATVLAPTKVGNLNWDATPSRVGYHSSAAISGGSVYTWGWDAYSQLGNGDSVEADSNVPTMVTCTDLAVNETNVAKLSLYPNPAKDFVVLQSSKAVTEVKIYNTAGSLIKTISKVSDNKINISDLAAGVYVVKTNVSESIKLIKK